MPRVFESLLPSVCLYERFPLFSVPFSCVKTVVNFFGFLRSVAFEVKGSRVTKAAEDFGIADNRYVC